MQVSTNPHICVFTLAFDPYIGGAEVAVDEVTKRLGDHATWTIFTARFSWRLKRYEVRRGIMIRRIGIGWKSIDKLIFPIAAWLAATRLHWRMPVTCTWALMANRAGLAALFFRWTHRDIPFVLTLQEGDNEEYIQRRSRWIGPLYGSIFRGATQITAISTYLATWPARYRAKAPVTVIPNGVDAERFSEPISTDERQSIRATFGVGEGECVLVTVSRLVEKNAVDVVIEATARIPHARVWVIGDGPLKDQLQSYARTRGIENRVSFMGTLPQDKIMRRLKAADVFVRPSRSEGLGNAFLEAMAAGIPVIGTTVGGISDFLTDHETGFTVRVDDPQHIVETVQWLQTHPSDVQRVVEAASRIVRERYQWDLIAGQYKKIFDTVDLS